MNRFVITVVLCAFSMTSFAQDFNAATESDPEAKVILDKIKQKYKSYKSLEAAFTLDIEIPEHATEVQKGKIAQQGEKYNLELGSQSVISDGTAIWLIMQNNKEVQINDMPEPGEDDNILSPQSLFTFYERDDFVFILANEFQDKKSGKVVQQIEFKPLDRDMEYSKLRLTVEKKTSVVQSIKAFGKDGSRYTFTLNQISPNKTFATSHFIFDKSKYPGYYIEDLRE